MIETSTSRNFGRYTFAVGFIACLFGCGGGGDDRDGSESPNVPLPQQYRVSVTVSGLLGSGLTLTLNDSESISPSSDGEFRFNTSLINGSSYLVSVSLNPTGPTQICDVSLGAGTIGSADVSNISVVCIGDQSNRIAYIPARFDQSLPQSAIGAITTFLTGYSTSSDPDRLIALVSESGRGSLVLAVDADGSLLLAANATESSVEFTVESTALGLIQMSAAELVSDLSVDQLRAIAESTSVYSAFLQDVESSMNSMSSMLDDLALVEKLLLLVDEINGLLLQQANQIVSPNQAEQVAGCQPTFFNRQSATFIVGLSNSTTWESVYFTGLADEESGGVCIKNTMAIDWIATSLLDGGCDIESCDVLLPSTGNVITRTLDWTEFWNVVDPVLLPGNGVRFDVALKQTNLTRSQNLERFLKTSIKYALSLFPGVPPSDKCVSDILTIGFLDSVSYSNLLNGVDLKLIEYLEDLGDSALSATIWNNVRLQSNLVQSCLVGVGTKEYFATFSRQLVKLLGAAKVINRAYSTSTLVLQGWELIEFWRPNIGLKEVCLGYPPSSSQLRFLSSCATALKFSPELVFMVRGSTANAPAADGITDKGATTMAPPNLIYLSPDPSIADVQSGLIVVPGNGPRDPDPIQVSVSTEPPSIQGEFVVDVGIPKLYTPFDDQGDLVIDRYPGMEIPVYLQGPNGESISGLPDGTIWSPESGAIKLVSESDRSANFSIATSALPGTHIISAGSRFGQGYDNLVVNVLPHPLTGVWEITGQASSDDPDCVDSETFIANVNPTFAIQDAWRISVTNPSDSSDLDISVISYMSALGGTLHVETNQTYAEDGGSTTAEISGDFTLDDRFAGQSVWRWTDGVDSCTGMTQLTGFKAQ